MAGVGRRTHYRKHLTDSVLNDFPVPMETERVAKVVATRGGNHFEILLASNDPSDGRKSVLAMLPTKFRKLVWLKRNDFVIVDTGEVDDVTEDNTGNDADADSVAASVAAAAAVTGIRYIISHILYKDQVRNLQVKGLWPVNDLEFGEQGMEEDEDAAADRTAEDGIVYDTGMEEDEYISVNNNRKGPAQAPDSSDSEDDG
jgi:probable RNA-binding protein EIF1AD